MYKIKTFFKKLMEQPVYNLTKDKNENILINDNFYFYFFPETYSKYSHINISKRTLLKFILKAIIKNNLIIPTFHEVLHDTKANYDFYKLSGFFGLKVIFLIVLFLLGVYTIKCDYIFSLILIYMCIINFFLLNIFNIYCKKHLNVFYINNIIPILYMFYLIYRFRFFNYFNDHLN